MALPERIGPYQPVRLLGRGGVADVFLVRPSQSGEAEPAALKWLREDLGGSSAAQARFLNEVTLLRRLHDLGVPGLVRCHEDGEWLGRPYLRMELLPSALDRVLQPGQALPLARVIALGRALAATLAALHTHRVVHRDIKPSNILLTTAGEPRLCDFGLAKDLGQPEDLIPHSTEAGRFLGTPGYAAPEQRISAKDVDTSADVYSLGVVLYRALGGRLPFDGLPDEVALSREAPPLDDPALPPALYRLVAAMLRRRRASRPDAAEVARRLTQLPARPRSPLARRAATTARRLALAGVLAPLLSGSLVVTYDDFDEALVTRPLPIAAAALAAAQRDDKGELAPRRWQKEADLRREAGDLAGAAAKYRAAYDALARGQDPRRRAACGNRLADALLHLGQVAEAEALYREALRDIERLTAREARPDAPRSARGDEAALTHYRLGQLRRARGDEPGAQTEFHAARALFAEPAAPAREPERDRDRARVATALGLVDEAEEAAHRAAASRPAALPAALALLEARFLRSAQQHDLALRRSVLSDLRAHHEADPQRGALGHERVELLARALRAPLNEDQWSLAEELHAVLADLQARGQLQGDRHLDDARALLQESPLAGARIDARWRLSSKGEHGDPHANHQDLRQPPRR